MNTLLRIDSSVRTENSFSRSLGDYLMKEWKEKNPDGVIIERDLARQPVPQLNEQTVNAFFSEIPEAESTRLSDELIHEMYQSNEILITSPMYNFGIPSSLKAYFDLVVRTKKTFTENITRKGLLVNKKAYVISSMGSILQEKQNPLEIHITQLLHHMGITDICYFPLDGTVIESRIAGLVTFQQSEISKHFNEL
jgi:FMN-dependent NADH-azoreductase